MTKNKPRLLITSMAAAVTVAVMSASAVATPSTTTHGGNATNNNSTVTASDGLLDPLFLRLEAWSTDGDARARFQPFGEVFSSCDFHKDGYWAVAVWEIDVGYWARGALLYDDSGPGCAYATRNYREGTTVRFKACETSAPNRDPSKVRLVRCSKDWVYATA